MKQNIAFFIRTQKQNQLLMKVTLIMYLDQFVVQLYEMYKNLSQKVQVGLLIQSKVLLLIFQSTIL